MAFVPIRTVVGTDDADSGFKPLREVYLGPTERRNVIAAGLSSGVDQLQGLGYNILGGAADIVGANTARDWANEQARRNQIDASLSGRLDLENIEEQSLSSALPYAGYQIAKQIPLMAGIAGAQFIPGVGQAASALGLTRLGALAPRVLGGGGLEAGASMAARRAALAQGESLATGTMAGSALGFGSMYGESVEGGDPSPWKALALSPLYGASEAVLPAVLQGGLRMPARFSGGLGTRMLKAGSVAGAGETLTELGQNELEMGMRSDLTDEQKYSRRLNAAAGGFLVGGTLGSSGGFRGQTPNVPVDLLSGQTEIEQPDTSTEQKPVLGLQYNPLAGTPIIFPDDTIALGSEQEMLARTGIKLPAAAAAAETDLTAPAGTTTAATTTTAAPLLFSKTDTGLNKLGVKPTKNSRAIYEYLEAEQIDPASPEAESVINALAQNKPGEARKAVGEIIRARSPRGTPVSTVPAAAGGVGVGSPVVQGAVGDAGPAPIIQPAVEGTAPAVGAPLQQTNVLPDTSGQPSTDVITSNTSGQPSTDVITSTAPTVTQAAPVAGSIYRRAPKPMTVLEAANAAKAAQAQKAAAGPEVDVADVAPEVAAVADKAKAEIVRVFGERDANILYAAFVENLPHEDIATRYGVSRPTVVKVAGDGAEAQAFREGKLKAAGGSEATLRNALNVLSNATRQQTLADYAAQTTTLDETELDKDLQTAGITPIETEGGSQSAWKDTTDAIANKTQQFYDLMQQHDELRKKIQVAQDAGYDTIATKNVKMSLEDAEGQAIAFKLKAEKLISDLAVAMEIAQSGGGKVKRTRSAPKAAKGEVASEVELETEADIANRKAAEKASVERAAKVAADRKGLKVGDTVTNPKLGTGTVKSFAGDGDAATVTVAFKSGQTKELSLKLAPLEKTNAVQVESTTGVSVQSETQAGQGVGKQVRSTEKPAGARQAKLPAPAPTKILTESEQAAQAWDQVAADYPTAPKFSDLTEDQRQDFIDFGPDNWERGDVEIELTKLAKSGMKFGKDGAPALVRKPYTAKQLLSELKAFIRADIPKRKLLVVESIADLINSSDENLRAAGVGIQLSGAYGVASDGRAFLIANRIKQGSGRAKFMHEVGGHLGLDNLLTKADQDKLVNQIKTWAKNADGSLETELALQAFERVEFAQTPKEDQRSELIAYFIESAMEMGVDPTAATDSKLSGPLLNWFRTLWAAFKIAARRLGMKPESMTAQDVVNLAYGAARLEINGTWHGTAAAFRNFRNKFIGSGEGATAYGWGTYLAERVGIAKGYFKADVERKTGLPSASYDGRSLKEIMDEIGVKEQFDFDLTDEEKALRTVISALEVELEFGGSNPLRSANMSIAKRAASDSFTSKSYKRASDWLDKNYSKFEVTPGKKPEGSLLRVDTAVDSRNVYNYDRPISKQPDSVRTALENALDTVSSDEIVDRTNKYVQELTGKDLIGTGENDLGLLGNLIMDDVLTTPKPDAKFDDAVRRGKFHEAASHYLRTLGVEGIKFYDARSRGSANTAISFDGKKYNRDELRDKVKDAYSAAQAAGNKSGDTTNELKFILLGHILRNGLADVKTELENKVAGQAERFEAIYIDSAARYDVKIDPVAERARAQEEAAKSYEGKQLAWLKANENKILIVENPKTRNLVVFDEKSSQRVGSEAAADRQRMKFGKNMPSQATVDNTIGKFPKQAQVPVRNSVNSLNDWVRGGIDRIVFTSDLVNRAVTAGLKTAAQFQSLLAKRSTKARELERNVERIADTYSSIEEKDKGSGPDSANQFIFDSTRTGKWGYGKYATPEMAARFNALGPKTQAFVKAVFTHGNTMLAAKKKAVMDYTASEYDARIAAETDPAKKSVLLNDKATDLKQFARLFQIREGIPYAPIKRFGDHVVIAKSKEFLAAVAANDTKLIKQLEQDPDHYHVSFTETKNEARNLAAQLDEQGHFDGGYVDFKEREDRENNLFGNADSLESLTRLKEVATANAAKAKKDDKTAAAVQRLISDMYLQALAEGSARKSEMRRRGVAGLLLKAVLMPILLLRWNTTHKCKKLCRPCVKKEMKELAVHSASQNCLTRLLAATILRWKLLRLQPSTRSLGLAQFITWLQAQRTTCRT